MEQEIVEEYGLSSTADFQQLKFNSSNSTVQNVHISNNKLKQNTINKKQTNIKDLVNKESHNTLENSLSKDDLIDIADEFYSEFAVGRWTKKQWFALIDKFITEIIDGDVEIVNPKKYIHTSLKNMAYKHDFKNGKVEFESNRKFPFYNWLEEGLNNKE